MIKGWFNTQNQPEQLINRYVATGKRYYLELLVVEFNQSLFHYLLSQVERQLAEDVLQITWLKVMNSAATFHDNGQTNSAKSWLFKIARHALIDELRKQQPWLDIDLLTPEHTNEAFNLSVEQAAINNQQLAAFNQAIQQLSFAQREAFIFQQEGFSVKDICALTGDSFETVKSRLRYAKANIKSYLESPHEH